MAVAKSPIYRRAWLLLILAGICLPALAGRRVSDEQLEQLLAAKRGASDVELAKLLYSSEPIERVSAARLTRCEALLPGDRSKQALMAFADVSAFLDPPADEILKLDAPDSAAQQKMIALTLDYVEKTIHQLPNFFASRVDTSFEDDPWFPASNGEFANYKPLHFIGQSASTVLYRRGHEVSEAAVSQSSFNRRGLTTSGEFGPILGTIVLDTAPSDLTWVRWEQGTAGPLAVYQYAAAAEKSHYKIEDKPSGYRGEIAVDPVTGTILRFVLRANLKRGPITRADILVEYAPVAIGDRTVICPVKGIAISATPDTRDALNNRLLIQMFVNDVSFDHFHLYQARARILDGAAIEPSANSPAIEPKTPQ